jgi:hypothetical protein
MGDYKRTWHRQTSVSMFSYWCDYCALSNVYDVRRLIIREYHLSFEHLSLILVLKPECLDLEVSRHYILQDFLMSDSVLMSSTSSAIIPTTLLSSTFKCIGSCRFHIRCQSSNNRLMSANCLGFINILIHHLSHETSTSPLSLILFRFLEVFTPQCLCQSRMTQCKVHC